MNSSNTTNINETMITHTIIPSTSSFIKVQSPPLLPSTGSVMIQQHELLKERKQQRLLSYSTSAPSFHNEIRKMMHAFGDVRTPLEESASLMEKIIKNQMELLIFEAESVAQTRGSSVIGVEEFLFLHRHDLNKLARIIRYHQFRDMKSNLTNTVAVHLATDPHKHSMSQLAHLAQSGDIGNESITKNDLLTNKNNKVEKKINNNNNNSTATSQQQPQTKSVSNTSASTRRVSICFAFLSSIDTPLERYAQLSSSDFYPDLITQERNRRLAEFTARMSIKDYLYFQACRSVSFACAGNVNLTSRFTEWMLTPEKRQQLKLKLNSLAVETLQHLALETVAILIEMSLLIKADESRSKSLAIDNGCISTIKSTFYEPNENKVLFYYYFFCM